MVPNTVQIAIAITWLLRPVTADPNPQLIPTATTTPAMNALTPQGCFSTPEPMIDHGPYTFQSKGNCQPICYELQQPVMGLVNGTNCWCGALVPPLETKVDDSNCSTPCAGIDSELCGGDNFWTVYLTGFTRNKIGNLASASLSGTSGSPKTKTSSSSAGPSTVVVTAGPSPSGQPKKSSNTVGVAVGVVVGVVVVAGIVLGVVLFLRHRRRQQIEDEYKRQAAVSSFVNGGKHHQSSSSANDSRLDPETLARRRESTGSIADNADYSRRILQVRNPDGF